MKKILFILSLLCFYLNLFAQHRDSENLAKKLEWDDSKLNILVDTRIDLQADFQDGKLEDRTFRGNALKIWLVGDITPNIHYRVRQRFNKTQTPLRDNYSIATDQAWISFDIDSKWTITAGKQAVQFGTFEYDYSGADVYLPTMIYNDLDDSKTGVNAAYRFAGQIINLQIVNSDAPQFADNAYKNKAMAINVLWVGSLLEGKVKTRWAYGAFQHSESKFYNWITLGTQLNIKKFTTELDYYIGDRNIDYSSIVNDANLGERYVKDQSASINIKYDLGKWKPSVKTVWNERYDKDFRSDAYQSKGIEAVMECYPFTNKVTKDLRFHAAYMYSRTNFKGEFANISNCNTQTLLVGTRWIFKAK
ncbi:porin [Dysgonomonas sp. HGC4]|uniref:porin n=1 Tax=Dysgonomonas sp. HGC4 TaxID=1658009 RepID=UPI000681A3AE|nr:porin [Dysgonomonas sp. HGC4]MBD8347294.1 hypothetical protein [Dysgonomonas sp. HGC4]